MSTREIKKTMRTKLGFPSKKRTKKRATIGIFRTAALGTGLGRETAKKRRFDAALKKYKSKKK